MSGTYPKREKFFANKFCRLLTKSAAAQELGPTACWLLTVVAHQEDSKRYKGPVTYYNQQLMPLVGSGGNDSFARARQKAVEAGWLHYEKGAKSVPGKYWVLIPDSYADLPDGPCDESDTFPIQEGNQEGKREETRKENPCLSTLTLNPNLTDQKGSEPNPAAIADTADCLKRIGNPDDSLVVAQACLAAHTGHLNRRQVIDAAVGIQEVSTPVRKPVAYFRATLAGSVGSHQKLTAILRKVSEADSRQVYDQARQRLNGVRNRTVDELAGILTEGATSEKDD